MPLKRTINLFLLTLYGLGTIIGAGIYVLVGKVAQEAGPYAASAFGVALIVAAFTAYSFAALTRHYPKASGIAYYVHMAFHQPVLTTLVGYGALLTGIVSAAVLARGFVGYFQVLVPINTELGIILIVTVLSVIAVLGLFRSLVLSGIMTVVEVFGLLLVIWILQDNIIIEQWQISDFIPLADQELLSGIALGAFIAFYAFIGFEDIVNIADEIKAPERTLPLAIILSFSIAGVLYMMVAFVSTMAVPLSELSSSLAPLSHVVKLQGYNPLLITLISCIAVINGMLAQIIMASRMIHSMAEVKTLPLWFAKMDDRFAIPLRATICAVILIIILALCLPLITLAKATSFIILFVFGMVNLSLVRINRREKQGKIRVLIPMIGAGLCLGLILAEMLL